MKVESIAPYFRRGVRVREREREITLYMKK